MVGQLLPFGGGKIGAVLISAALRERGEKGKRGERGKGKMGKGGKGLRSGRLIDGFNLMRQHCAQVLSLVIHFFIGWLLQISNF